MYIILVIAYVAVLYYLQTMEFVMEYQQLHRDVQIDRKKLRIVYVDLVYY